jgi:hypothetical protein
MIDKDKLETNARFERYITTRIDEGGYGYDWVDYSDVPVH